MWLRNYPDEMDREDPGQRENSYDEHAPQRSSTGTSGPEARPTGAPLLATGPTAMSVTKQLCVRWPYLLIVIIGGIPLR